MSMVAWWVVRSRCPLRSKGPGRLTTRGLVPSRREVSGSPNEAADPPGDVGDHARGQEYLVAGGVGAIAKPILCWSRFLGVRVLCGRGRLVRDDGGRSKAEEDRRVEPGSLTRAAVLFARPEAPTRSGLP